MRKAWPVTLTAILAGIAIAVSQNKVAPCLGVLQSAFQIDMSAAGWLSSVFSVMGILMALPAALLTGRIGPRRACLLSLGAAIAGGLLGLTARSFPLLLLSRVVEGIGAGIIAVAVPSIIARYFPPEKRGLPTGIWSSWQFVAQALCFFFGVSVTDAFGWQGAWWVGVLFAGGAAVLSALIIRVPAGPGGDASPQAAHSVSLRAVAGQRSVLAICFAMFCFCFTCFGFVTWAPTCWSQRLGFSLEQANWFISIFAILSIPAVLVVGWLIDRVSHRRIAVLACLGYGLMMLWTFLMPGRAFMVPYLLVYPFFEGAVSTSLWTVVPQTPQRPQEAPTAIALFNLSSNCGMLIGPPVAGAVAERFGWGVLAIPLALAMAASALGAFWARERRSEEL